MFLLCLSPDSASSSGSGCGGASSPRPSSPLPGGNKRATPATPLERRRVNKQNGKGETPLHGAAINGDLRHTKKLIKQGADVNLKDFAGELYKRFQDIEDTIIIASISLGLNEI